MIKVLRIDDRLMHAQVTFGWANSMNIKGILIISDHVANDSTARMAVQFAKPEAMKLWIKSVSEGPAAVKKMNTFSYNTMVLVESVQDAWTVVKQSGCIPYVNLGGQRKEEGRNPILGTVFVSDHDLATLRKIEALGIRVEVKKMITDDGYALSSFL